MICCDCATDEQRKRPVHRVSLAGSVLGADRGPRCEFATQAFLSPFGTFGPVPHCQPSSADCEEPIPSQATKRLERSIQVKEPRFIQLGAALGSVLLCQSALAQSSSSSDRIDGGQAIQIEKEPNSLDTRSKSPATGKRLQERPATAPRRARARAFLVPRRQ
jgi:hypothetical protein